MPEAQTRLKIAGHTDTGRRRDYNQDHIGFDQELGIAVLADGMGGHKAGEVAAHMAVKFVLDKLQKLILQETYVSITGSQLLEFVSNTISSSNTEIFRAQKEEEAYIGMGTTIVATVVTDSQIYVGHVGDSRLYLYPQPRSETLNQGSQLGSRSNRSRLLYREGGTQRKRQTRGHQGYGNEGRR